ncbi:MAG: hypothetical protein J5662_01160 [Clostridia bacterium]|nr:hypothetical protein [Clostridia bacterium]
MDVEKNKNALKKYRVLLTKISRLKGMIPLCPENKEKYIREIKRCTAARDEIERAIESVDGDILSEILSLKYMCGKTIEEISLDICYSRRQTERMHVKGLTLIKI